VKQQVRQLHIPVAGVLGVPQRLEEGIVADPVQFAGYGLEADIGHGCPL
jgi:hypothetical protein